MKLKFAVILTIVIVALLIVIRPSTAQGGECNQCDNEHCIKLDIGGTYVSWSVPAESSSYIIKVEVKAGSDNQDGGACHTFTENGNNGCYAVSGIGTKTASVTKIGVGSGCKDISHVLFHWWADHLGTPTPSPTLPPTATATIPPSSTPTSTPGPSPTPTNTPNPRWTPTPTVPVPTLTLPPLPSPTPTDVATPTPKPDPKIGFMRGYLFCKHSDGSIGQGRGPLVVATDNLGVLGGYPWPSGHVFTQATAPDTGTTVIDAGPGECYRGGDSYPQDPTLYDLDAQPVFGAGNVGNSAVVCFEDCIDTSTFFLPESGDGFVVWFVNFVIRHLIY